MNCFWRMLIPTALLFQGWSLSGNRVNWRNVESQANVFNATKELRSALNTGISDGLQREFDLGMNGTRVFEKWLKLLNNGSLNLRDVAIYLPPMYLADSAQEAQRFLKKIRNNAIKKSVNTNNVVNTILKVINASNAKSLPSKIVEQPTAVLDNLAGVGRVLSESVLNNLYWTFESIPRARKEESDEEQSKYK
ncbi:unnamed protein product [Allacma fusca]|uniref:Uncharacterized protein n=1 Tax=Allacma fusca TaxID=39272 RepID=A0A8J2JB84_9HEXA|nr:unnamed protein product [Allacma fusca]